MKQLLFLLSLLPLIVGCNTIDADSSKCTIIPPEKLKSDESDAVSAAVDLQKFSLLPLTASSKAEIKNTFEATFQRVPDKSAACAMLLQTYACITDRKRAKDFMDYMKSSNACDQSKS